MQQFQVPQFIEVEDKIFGPLTVKQFIYLLAGGAFLLILWLIGLPFILFVIIGGIVGGFFAALAFLKVNGQPFVVFLNNATNHWFTSHRYTWQPRKHSAISPSSLPPSDVPYTPKLTKNRLTELAWSLDINSTKPIIR